MIKCFMGVIDIAVALESYVLFVKGSEFAEENIEDGLTVGMKVKKISGGWFFINYNFYCFLCCLFFYWFMKFRE